jgi:hypothetical protein
MKDEIETSLDIAGHAFMAMGYGFNFEKLSPEGFSQTGTIDRHEHAQRLDDWTMRRSDCSFSHGRFNGAWLFWSDLYQ